MVRTTVIEMVAKSTSNPACSALDAASQRSPEYGRGAQDRTERRSVGLRIPNSGFWILHHAHARSSQPILTPDPAASKALSFHTPLRRDGHLRGPGLLRDREDPHGLTDSTSRSPSRTTGMSGRALRSPRSCASSSSYELGSVLTKISPAGVTVMVISRVETPSCPPRAG